MYIYSRGMLRLQGVGKRFGGASSWDPHIRELRRGGGSSTGQSGQLSLNVLSARPAPHSVSSPALCLRSCGVSGSCGAGCRGSRPHHCSELLHSPFLLGPPLTAAAHCVPWCLGRHCHPRCGKCWCLQDLKGMPALLPLSRRHEVQDALACPVLEGAS